MSRWHSDATKLRTCVPASKLRTHRSHEKLHSVRLFTILATQNLRPKPHEIRDLTCIESAVSRV